MNGEELNTDLLHKQKNEKGICKHHQLPAILWCPLIAAGTVPCPVIVPYPLAQRTFLPFFIFHGAEKALLTIFRMQRLLIGHTQINGAIMQKCLLLRCFSTFFETYAHPYMLVWYKLSAFIRFHLWYSLKLSSVKLPTLLPHSRKTFLLMTS